MSAWQITRCKFLPAPRDTREGGEDSGVIDWRQRNAGPVIKTVGDPCSCGHVIIMGTCQCHQQQLAKIKTTLLQRWSHPPQLATEMGRVDKILYLTVFKYFQLFSRTDKVSHYISCNKVTSSSRKLFYIYLTTF